MGKELGVVGGGVEVLGVGVWLMIIMGRMVILMFVAFWELWVGKNVFLLWNDGVVFSVLSRV